MGSVHVLPSPRPHPARRAPPFPVEGHNPWGEWRNPYSDELLDLRRELEHLPPDYHASVAYIRAGRPSVPARALQFWNTHRARAHAMIALLHRGDRSIARLHLDLGVGHDKFYTYLPRWKVEWRRRPDEAVAQDPTGERQVVIVERWHEDGTATVRLPGYALRAVARWVPQAWEFRLPAPLTPDAYVTPDIAGKMLNLQPLTVLSVLPVTAQTAHRRPLIALADVARLLPEPEWRATLKDASRDHNPCHCAYWHAHSGTCSLQPDRALPQAGTAPYACEDHHDPL